MEFAVSKKWLFTHCFDYYYFYKSYDIILHNKPLEYYKTI